MSGVRIDTSQISKLGKFVRSQTKVIPSPNSVTHVYNVSSFGSRSLAEEEINSS